MAKSPMKRDRARRLTGSMSVWFRKSARKLPWRQRRTAYHSLVSEFMLQQTQVSRVLEYFPSFIKRFPTMRSLAEADEQEVLAAWQGLGYYRRARNLHRTARQIMTEHGGRLPREIDQLMDLPGIGRFTAGSLASILFGQAQPIVDGNVLRVLSRLEGESLTDEQAWHLAEILVNQADDPAVFNESLMEMGAIVCTPSAPQCGACDLKRLCRARRQGIQEEVPVARSRKKPKQVNHYVVIVRWGKKLLFQKRPPEGLWSNMWQLPTIESDQVRKLHDLAFAAPVSELCEVGRFDHQTTHRRIRFYVLEGQITPPSAGGRSGTWRRPGDVGDLPMSNAQRKVLAMASSQAS
jgi:A/G-specific adenine glycosylase